MLHGVGLRVGGLGLRVGGHDLGFKVWVPSWWDTT